MDIRNNDSDDLNEIDAGNRKNRQLYFNFERLTDEELFDMMSSDSEEICNIDEVDNWDEQTETHDVERPVTDAVKSKEISVERVYGR